MSQQRPDNTETLLNWVQEHERHWGKDKYPLRPTLTAILDAKVVVFWAAPEAAKQKFDTISLFEDQAALEKFLGRALLDASNLGERRIHRIFVEKQQMLIAGVQVRLAPVDPKPNLF